MAGAPGRPLLGEGKTHDSEDGRRTDFKKPVELVRAQTACLLLAAHLLLRHFSSGRIISWSRSPPAVTFTQPLVELTDRTIEQEQKQLTSSSNVLLTTYNNDHLSQQHLPPSIRVWCPCRHGKRKDHEQEGSWHICRPRPG